MTNNKTPIQNLALLAGIGRIIELHTMVAADTNELRKMLQDIVGRPEGAPGPSGDQFSFLVRSVTRAYFAEVEAVSHAMGVSALEFYEQGLVALSPAEQLLLREVSCVIDNGRAKERPQPNKFLDNLQLRFRIFLRAFGVDSGLNIGDHRWDAFKKILQFRHSITHPKDRTEFTPTLETVAQLKEAMAWFLSQIQVLTNICKALAEESSSN